MRHAKTIWSVRCPLKIRVFLWLIEKNVLLTWDNLQRRGWVGPSICTLCGNEEETIKHITLRCDSVRSLWLLCTDYSPAPSPHNANVTSTWEHDYVSRHRGPNPHTLIAPMVWNVQRERNNRIFRSTEHSIKDAYLLYILTSVLGQV